MRHRTHALTAVLIVTLVVLVGGCGGGNDGGSFADCGNGVLDGGEECDDGNLSDNDACLSTCKLNVCGDFFINFGVEQCEQGGLIGGLTCAGLGFAGGTLTCSPQCTLDTSGCTGTVEPPTPTPAVTPLPSGEPTSMPASEIPTPTPASTPSGAACQAGDQVVVVAALDQQYGAARVDLQYPDAVNIPGTGTAQTVVDRVHFAASGGLTTVSDNPVLGAVDDTLTASFVGFSDNPPGAFVTVTFDCIAGQTRPVAEAFVCTVVSASTAGGVQIPDEHCAVTVQ